MEYLRYVHLPTATYNEVFFDEFDFKENFIDYRIFSTICLVGFYDFYAVTVRRKHDGKKSMRDCKKNISCLI